MQIAVHLFLYKPMSKICYPGFKNLRIPVQKHYFLLRNIAFMRYNYRSVELRDKRHSPLIRSYCS